MLEEIIEFLLEGGYSEPKEGTSDRAAEKSSYEGMSETPPDVDMVNDEPDIRRGLSAFSKFVDSLSGGHCCP